MHVGRAGEVQYKLEFDMAAVLWKCQWLLILFHFDLYCVTSIDATVNLISRGIYFDIVKHLTYPQWGFAFKVLARCIPGQLYPKHGLYYGEYRG